MMVRTERARREETFMTMTISENAGMVIATVRCCRRTIIPSLKRTWKIMGSMGLLGNKPQPMDGMVHRVRGCH